MDAYRITLHLGSHPLTNGYDKIAADVDNSGTITLADAKLINKLVAGVIPDFKPYFQEPWRFVPEYIPQDYTTGFDSNPFNMTINGQQVLGLAYTQDTWEYQIADGTAGKAGYDGIKIGDVTQLSDVVSPQCDPDPTMQFPVTLLPPDKTFEISLKSVGFNNIAAFQLGFFVDTTKIKILEVSGSSLSGFTQAENV